MGINKRFEEETVLPKNSLMDGIGGYLTYEVVLGEKNSAKMGVN